MAGGVNWGPPWYICSACSASQCKLWRDRVRWNLYCVVCAMHKVGWKYIDIASNGTNWTPDRGHSNLIGTLEPDILVPALLIKHPDEDERLSHAVIGMDGTVYLERWQGFPTYPAMRPDPKTVWARLVDGIGI